MIKNPLIKYIIFKLKIGIITAHYKSKTTHENINYEVFRFIHSKYQAK